jgi:hypothetical protein
MVEKYMKVEKRDPVLCYAQGCTAFAVAPDIINGEMYHYCLNHLSPKSRSKYEDILEELNELENCDCGCKDEEIMEEKE